jgi:hypothetical protein
MHGLKLASFNNGNMVIAALDESHISPNQVCPQTLQTFDRYADRYRVNSQLHIGLFCCSITNETHWSGNRISDNFYDCVARRLFAVFREYFKDRRDERKTPVLKNEKIPIKKLQHFSTGVQTNYFLRILKTSGQGIAKECHGFIDMKDYRHKITIWDDFERSQYTKISIFEDLLLFGILQNEMIFCSNSTFTEDGRRGGTYTNKPYNDYVNEQMSVNIGAANAKVPGPFIMEVKEIVDNAILKQ